MAEVTRSIHVRVMSYDPGQGVMIPVPSASLLVEDSGWLWDPDLSDGSFVTDAEGRTVVDVTFEEEKENSLNPFFTITIPEANRRIPSGATADRQIELPGEWVTRHYVRRRIPRISEHTTPARPLDIYVGLDAQLRVAYSDFHESGVRNPFAIPEDTARIHLADYDEFLWIDFLNPDDVMTGAGFDARANRIVKAGEEERYPYVDLEPTAPSALDGDPDPAPRAWIDPPGSPVGWLGGGSFEQTGPLAVDAHGFVFMVDGDRVQRFYPDGTHCETIVGPGAGFSAPAGLALDQHRHLYVADTGNDRVCVLALSWGDGGAGAYQHVRNSPFTAAFSGSFSGPSGLAVVPNRAVDGDELLVVADTGNDRARVFRIHYPGFTGAHRTVWDLSGFLQLTHLADFGASGSGPGQFDEPIGVAADRQGRIFVCDRALHRISRWAPDAAGTAYVHEADWERSGGGSGSGDREFDRPTAIAADWVNGYVYVAEEGNHRIQRLDADTGDHLAHWVHEYAPALGSDFTPISVAVDPRAELYAADAANDRVLRATVFGDSGASLADGDEPRAIGDPWTPIDDPSHMRRPGYLFFDPDGRLWVSDTGNDRIQIFERDPAGKWAPAAGVTPPSAGFDAPVGIARDGAGNIFIVDSGNDRVVPFDGVMVAQPALGSSGSGDDEFDDPRGIAVAQRVEPILYVADRGNDRVQYLRRDGTFEGRLTTDGTLAFRAPEDVAVDSTGAICVADTGNGRIVRFAVKEDGTHIFERAIPLPVKVRGVSPRPSGISIDDRDNLLVTDSAQSIVFLLEADGDLLAWWDLRALLRQDHATSMLYEPDLARLVTFFEPTRAVFDNRGVMAVADTGHDRVRLVRVFSEVRANLFELGERLPDISFRAVTKNRFSGDLGLELNVGDVSIFDESHDFIGEPEDDFSLDSYEHRQILTKSNSTNAAINVMKVIRGAQRWYHHHTREAPPEARWGTEANSRTLNVDLISGDNSYQFLDVNMGEDSPHGRGSDAWDDSVVVHEMTHWVFFRAARPNPPMSLVGLWDISRSHSSRTISSFNQALSEGWAGYVEMFWGREFGSVDRVRGFPMYQSLGRAGIVPRPSETIGEVLLHLIVNEPTVSARHLYGGPTSVALPTFEGAEDGLRNEGYFANALYQIHTALTDPERAFADASSYWYQYNACISDVQSKRFSDTIWGALRRFPVEPTLEDIDRGTAVYLRQVLEGFRDSQPDLAQLAQSILELNNQLMPRISITEGVSSSSPGTALADSLEIPVTETRNFVIQVTDALGSPLRGYSVRIEVGNAADFTLPAGPGPVVRHGRRLAAGATPPSTELWRATNAQGIINLTFNAPTVAGDQTLRVTYQPDFDADESFAPPVKGDDRETVLRKLYMYQLRAAGKTWGGTGTNFGARVSRSLTLRVTG